MSLHKRSRVAKSKPALRRFRNRFQNLYFSPELAMSS